MKTAEMLISFTKLRNKCANEFFEFIFEILNYCEIDFSFLETYTLDYLINECQSWHTFSNVLNLAKNIQFEESTVDTICKIIHTNFEWNWDIALHFFSSSEEVLKLSYKYWKNNYHKDKRGIKGMTKFFEALQFYTSNIEKKKASGLFDKIRLDDFINEPEVLDNFLNPIERIIYAQLANEDYSKNLLNSFFGNLCKIKNKSLEHAKLQVSMLAIYYYLATIEDAQKVAKAENINQYLMSVIDQFESKLNWPEDEILDFFKATFSFIPEIQPGFNTILLEKLLSNWKPKRADLYLKDKDPSAWSDEKLQSDIISLSRTISLVGKVLKLKINSEEQFDYFEVKIFENFIDEYIAIIELKDAYRFFLFYKNINNYLNGFKIKKISYDDSKHPETIAKYFICLIRNSLTEHFENTFIKNQNAPQERIEEDKNSLEEEKHSLSMKNIPIKKDKFKEIIDSVNEIELQENKEINKDELWIKYWESRNDQICQLNEFRSSFLHKIVFSNNDERFILRQYLASHLTRLFNGTLNQENTNFFSEGKQRAIKLYFSHVSSLSYSQKEELSDLLRSTPVREAFDANNIWNDDIERLLERTYFADISDNLSGLTVFGGTILLHWSFSEDIDLKSCALKITLIHEAAHAMRKYNKGSYNAEKKPPKSTKSELRIGMPGCKDFLTDLKEKDKNEGGKLIENAIFGAFFTKINQAQIDYINDWSNWDQDAETFRSNIEAKGNEASKTYDLARGNHYISRIRNGDSDHF